MCLLKLGHAYQAMGNLQAAIGRLEEGLDIFGQLRLNHYAERARRALVNWQHKPAVAD